MKVYISQGHEQGIGLEVLFRSILLMSKKERSVLELIAYPKSVTSSLTLLRIPFALTPEGLHFGGVFLNAHWLENIDFSQSFTALNIAMEKAQAGGLLYTLPTSKDQFPADAGHTEYFRSFYKQEDLGMFFSSPSLRVLLLSDHIPLASISSTLNPVLLESRLRLAISTLQKWHWPIGTVLLAGLNPHAGENGLIGDEDERIKLLINRLGHFDKIKIAGPYPGDTMLFEQKSSDDILVYLYHDQGLGVFKTQQGFIGSNITLGLPYPRFSPDHGTSFKLYGKSEADYRGCAYSLREAICLLQRIENGQNSGHQG